MSDRRVMLSTVLIAAAAAAVTVCRVSRPALAQVPEADGGAVPSAADALLGPTFTSRLDGVSFRPPAGGIEIRQLDSGEVVRFQYAERTWTLVVKSVVNSARLPLSAPGMGPTGVGPTGVAAPVTNLLDTAADQLTNRAGQPATLLRKEVVNVGPRPVGLVEARDGAGINRVFTQLALVPDGRAHYFLLQMVSPGQDPAVPGLAGPAGLAQENDARQQFRRSLATVAVLDHASFRAEQKEWLLNTRGLWVQIDAKQVTSAVLPVHFMRIVRDGKDIGYVQINERVEQHHGQDGVLICLREHIETPAAPAPAAPAAAANAPGQTPGVDLPGPTPAGRGAAPDAAPAGPPQPSQLDRDARFFVSFDRAHEDWTAVTRVNNQPGSDLITMGNSDTVVHRALNVTAVQQAGPGAGGQPPVLSRSVDTLQVDDFREAMRVPRTAPANGAAPAPAPAAAAARLPGEVRTGVPIQQPLPPYYLPQAMGQMLPRLVPANQPKSYLFAFYVAEQRKVLLRYVDVGQQKEVELDGQRVQAVPISDRIGADGAVTVHYVTRAGNEWLGSVSEDGKLQVFPTDEHQLAGLWKGFAVLPEPPAPTDEEPATPRHPSSHARTPAPVEPAPTSILPPALDSGTLDGR